MERSLGRMGKKLVFCKGCTKTLTLAMDGGNIALNHMQTEIATMEMEVIRQMVVVGMMGMIIPSSPDKRAAVSGDAVSTTKEQKKGYGTEEPSVAAPKRRQRDFCRNSGERG